jgi:hypothetical protein
MIKFQAIDIRVTDQRYNSYYPMSINSQELTTGTLTHWRRQDRGLGCLTAERHSAQRTAAAVMRFGTARTVVLQPCGRFALLSFLTDLAAMGKRRTAARQAQSRPAWRCSMAVFGGGCGVCMWGGGMGAAEEPSRRVRHSTMAHGHMWPMGQHDTRAFALFPHKMRDHEGAHAMAMFWWDRRPLQAI